MEVTGNSANRGASLTEDRSVVATNAMIGEVKAWAGIKPPNDFIWCDGTLLPGTAASGYNSLALAIGFGYGAGAGTGSISYTSGNETITCDSADQVSVGDAVSLEFGEDFSEGADGVRDERIPFLVKKVISPTQFTISEYFGGPALVSSATRSGSGWSNRFGVPDLRDRQIVGRADMGTTDAARIDEETGYLGETGGSDKHSEVPEHTHDYEDYYSAGTTQRGNITNAAARNFLTHTTRTTEPAGTPGGVNHMDPYQVLNFIIRFR